MRCEAPGNHDRPGALHFESRGLAAFLWVQMPLTREPLGVNKSPGWTATRNAGLLLP
jgi:hypothetical protein